jgi:hypothetical protein
MFLNGFEPWKARATTEASEHVFLWFTIREVAIL